MGKYEPLTEFLRRSEADIWNASFSDIERLLGFSLPASAYKYPEWWANEKNGGRGQKLSWSAVGWRTAKVDVEARTVRFERDRRAAVTSSSGPDMVARSHADMLFERAQMLTGISDRDELVGMALEQLIASLAASRLAGMGGTMPGLELPPRERPAV
ncbi:hypothetical protein [Blastomonas sp.]|uniref:DUF7662 domain-containing protein n=1 Tax=Blastomonas sp. TaxID=1909299 RepID=UPI00391C62C6